MFFHRSYCGNPLSFDISLNRSEINNSDFNWGLTNFDNLGQAFLTIFQSITGEGWSSILYVYWNSYNALFSSIFFCAVILIGNFFMLNLILAAINNSFIEFNCKENLEKMRSMNKREKTLSPQSPDLTTAKLKQKMKLHEPERIKKHLYYRICYNIAYNPLFVLFSLLIILGNSILLGLNRYPLSDEDLNEIELGLSVFIFYFVFELIIRISAIGFKSFCKDRENVIETATVLIGLSNFIYEQVNISKNMQGSGNNMLKAVRSLMILRIIKVMNFFKSIKLIMKTIKRTIWKMLDFGFVVIIFMYVSSLIGMQLFAYRVQFDQNDNPSNSPGSKSHRVNFDTFGNAFLTGFALFVGDNWYSYMFDTIRAYSENSRIYFLIVVYLGNLTLINVFTAILISTFGEESEKLRKNFKKTLIASQSIDYEQFWTVKLKKFKPFFCRFFEKNYAILIKTWICIKNIAFAANVQLSKIKKDRFSMLHVTNLLKIFPLSKNSPHNLIFPEKTVKRGASKSFHQYSKIAGLISAKENNSQIDNNLMSHKKRWSILTNLTGLRMFNQTKKLRKPSELLYQNDFKNNIFLSIEQSYRNNLIDFQAFNEKVKHMRRKDTKTSKNLNEEFNIMSKLKADFQGNLEGVALNYFTEKSKLRLSCKKLLNNPFFESFILFLIVISCLFLAVSDPLSDPNSSFNLFLFIFDLILAGIFLVEIIIKIINHGLILNGKGSYLRNGWNFFDFMICFFFIFSTAQAIGLNLTALKSLRLARILKALRLIPKNEGLKLTINSFLKALPTLFNLILLVFSFFYICSVFLVNNFKGALYYCTIGSYDKTDCFDNGGDWVNQDMNMDNVWNAMANLLAISTTDNWMQTMFNLMDSVGIDKSPVQNYGMIWQYFTEVFMSISTFVVMNLFTSLVVDSYHREKYKQIGISSVSHQQKEWIKLQMRIFSMPPKHNVSFY